MTSDADLIIRIRSGDPDAAAMLVRRYYDECWQFAYRMVGHRAGERDAQRGVPPSRTPPSRGP